MQSLTIRGSTELVALVSSATSHPPPPPPRQRRPVPAESLRRQFNQCSQCHVVHSVSKPLKKCSGCLVDKYCSRECQKMDWPFHKVKCKRNQSNRALWMPERHIAVEALRKFVAKHRPTIVEAALQAFKLRTRPQQALHNVLVVCVSDRRNLFPGSRVHRETAFYVTEVMVHDIAQVGPVRDILQDEVVRVNIDARTKGMKGAVFVVFICSELDISAILPVDFPFTVEETEGNGDRWKQKMIAFMNNGIVF
ncbi:hypothetical protein GYMLUDRAFT_252064 [Collybiopsis luxurians FD-317 M1]|uniref:MYND-type domain-containing protein n=1 Tax=Collybiopsis luxurians FD-317 M1 TaxID=944289 RepID=A0A0D0C9I8_9AGAR|nr:hypothetical protein GYMLUDRAFT_252064 [Collybiopsis luxurians FD-317 M1]